MSRAQRWWALAAPVAIVLAVFIAFGPVLAAGFVSFDDLENIEQNYHFRGLESEQLAWMFTTGHMGHYHPLTWISLGADYTLGGLDAGTFHRTNVALHSLSAVAFYFVARRVLRLASSTASGVGLGALAAALFFAIHPLRVESVAWVTERRDVLSGLFFLLCVLAWLRWAPSARSSAASPALSFAALGLALAGVGVLAASVDTTVPEVLGWGPLGVAGAALSALLIAGSVAAATRVTNDVRSAVSRWFWLATAALVLSLFSKAWGIVMPAVLLVLDVWPLRRFAGEPALRRWRILLAEKVPFAALSIIFMRAAAWAQSSRGGTMLTVEQHGLFERAAQGFYGLAFYPFKTLFPAGLMPIYELPRTMSLAAPRFAVPAVVVVLVTAVLFARRRRWPAGLAAWVAYVAIVSPVLGVAQSGPQLVADRYAYLACLPLALLAGGIWTSWSRRGPGATRAAITLLVALTVVSTVATRDRARVWHDSVALWEAAYEVNPESPVTLLSLGVARTEQAASEADTARARGLLGEAEELLQRGFELQPGPRYLGSLSRVQGALARIEPERRREHRQRALEYSRRALDMALERESEPLTYRLNYAVDLLNLGRADDAVPQLEAYVAQRPLDYLGQLNLGFALGVAGRHADAVGPLEEAVRLEPGSADAWGKLGDALMGSQRRDEAARAYRRVLALSPGHPVATQRLQQIESGS